MSNKKESKGLSDFETQMRELADEIETLSRAESPAECAGGSPGDADADGRDDALGRVAAAIEKQGVALASLLAFCERMSSEDSQRAQLVEQLKKKNALESANQKLFDAMHEEMKAYKGNALFEAIQRPVVLDIVNLREELRKVLKQFAGLGTDLLEKIETPVENLSHLHDFTGEVLERLSVNVIDDAAVEYDKQIHRAVEVEPAGSEAEDGSIAARLGDGYRWRESVIKPVDVRIRKWKK